MPRYRALLFDLCDTLVHFDAERLPLVEIANRPTRSTALAIHQALPGAPSIPFEDFYAALLAVTDEIAAARERDHREVTSHERFRRVLTRLGLEADLEVADRLVAAHMTRLADALVLPPHHRNLLDALGKTHRLAIVSNFDHAPTVYALLQRERLVSYFDAVVVSGELGWRKPHRLIFDTALQGLGVSAEQALFVGDNFELDVVGAARAGIAAVWYTRGRTVQPPSDRPDYPVVTDLANLMRLG